MKKSEMQELNELVAKMLAANTQFNEKIDKRVEKVEKQVEKAYLPVNLEQEVLRTAQTSIAEAIQGVFSGYNSPLTKLIVGVVEENNNFLKSLISDSFSQVIRKEEFKKSIIDAFSHKVARTIISNQDGLFERVSNELKQDSVFKAKMSIAVANVVEECLNEKKDNKV